MHMVKPSNDFTHDLDNPFKAEYFILLSTL